MKIVHGFWVFKYALMVRKKTLETPEVKIELSKLKNIQW